MKIWVYISLLLLASCVADESPVKAPQLHHLKMEIHANQPRAFIDLYNKAATYPEHKEWHLKFQNADHNWAIFLNPMLDLTVHKSTFIELESLGPQYVVQNELSWQRDLPLDKDILPAIGTWGDYSFKFPQSFNNVYVLRLKKSNQLSYWKFQILGATKDRYTLEIANLDGSKKETVLVPKSNDFTHSYLALDSVANVVNMEPHKALWHLNLSFGVDSNSRNEHQIELENISDSLSIYQIFGVNKNAVKLWIERDIPFEDISYFHAKDLSYVDCEQISNPFIYYNKDEQQYELKKNCSLICLSGGYYYKIRLDEAHFSPPDEFSFELDIQNL
ncbi:MAG: hypothetical protein JXR19_06825 [Bacteroidia bacterium]